MFGRRKLPVLAEISAPVPGESRVWSLRRADLDALAALRAPLAGHRVVLVCGTEALVGAVALAGASSAAGGRTALVECDFARPRLAAGVGLAAEPGLHEYLRREAAAPGILQSLVLAGSAARGASAPLVCVAAGRPAPDPETLTELEGFRHALAKLRRAYDLTVLLGPSLEVAPGGSPAAVAAQADAVIAAVPPRGLSGRPGRQLRAQLRRLRTEALGALAVGAR